MENYNYDLNRQNVRKEKTYRIIKRDLEAYEQYEQYLYDKISIGRELEVVELQDLWMNKKIINLLKSLLDAAEKSK